MKKSVLLVFLSFVLLCSTLMGCASNQTSEAKTIEIVDQANRTVTVPTPKELNKVFFTSPLGMIMVYTLVPDKLAGVSSDLSEEELAYLNPALKEAPNLGGMQAGAELNPEAIINSGAQIIFSIAPEPISETSVSEANQLQEQLNIPVVVVDGSMEKAASSYAFLGSVLGEEERAKTLGDYCTKVFEDVVNKVSDIPDDQKVSVYYAEKNDGLSTEPSTSSHAAVLKYAGAKNVATVEAKKGSGMSPVSLEQVLTWDPDVIIAWGADRGGAYDLIKTDKDWSNVKAVKDDRVYSMPNKPFSWMDRPPSVNRFLGVQWVAHMLYPDVYTIDMKEQTKEFYKLFYSVDLTDEQLNKILEGAI